jgi:hypothetical protein
MRPAAIAALLLPWAALAQTAAEPRAAPAPPSGQRLTLLLNVGSVLLRGGSFSGGADHRLMYAAISSLSHRASAVKLVVFDANRQHELLRLEAFSLADLNKVSAAMEKWKLGPVDYHALQRDPGAVDIVASLIDEQLHAARFGGLRGSRSARTLPRRQRSQSPHHTGRRQTAFLRLAVWDSVPLGLRAPTGVRGPNDFRGVRNVGG